MMQMIRRSWIAALCLLVGASTAPAQQLKLLPGDTEMILTFNVQQLLKSEVANAKESKLLVDLAKGKIEEQLEDKGLAKHLKKADFDLFRDLSSITIAVPGGRNPEDGFILLEGKFNADKIEAAATEAAKDAGGGLKLTKIAGVKAFEVAPKDEKPMYVGILDEKTLIACANKADFEEAVARMKGTKSGFKAAVVKNLMNTVNAKQSINMIATSNILGELAKKAPNAGGQAQQAIEILKTMEGFSAALTIQKDIDIQVGVNTKDNDTAQKYSGIANLAIGVAKMKLAEQAKQNEKLLPAVDIVNSVRVTAMGANLVINGQISFDNLKKLMEALPIPN
jgi:hypothetical protein